MLFHLASRVPILRVEAPQHEGPAMRRIASSARVRNRRRTSLSIEFLEERNSPTAWTLWDAAAPWGQGLPLAVASDLSPADSTPSPLPYPA